MNNILPFTGNTDWSRDKIIDHLERCQMAATVTMPAENFEHLLTQVLRYFDSCAEKPVVPEQNPVAWRCDNDVARGIVITVHQTVADSWISKGWKVTPLFERFTAQSISECKLQDAPTEDCIPDYLNGAKRLWWLEGAKWAYSKIRESMEGAHHE